MTPRLHHPKAVLTPVAVTLRVSRGRAQRENPKRTRFARTALGRRLDARVRPQLASLRLASLLQGCTQLLNLSDDLFDRLLKFLSSLLEILSGSQPLGLLACTGK